MQKSDVKDLVDTLYFPFTGIYLIENIHIVYNHSLFMNIIHTRIYTKMPNVSKISYRKRPAIVTKSTIILFLCLEWQHNTEPIHCCVHLHKLRCVGPYLRPRSSRRCGGTGAERSVPRPPARFAARPQQDNGRHLYHGVPG